MAFRFCRRSQLDRIEDLLHQVLANQNTELKETHHMAASLADLDVELAKSDTSVAAIKADNDKIIALLQAAPPSPDVTAQLTHLQNVNAALSAIQAEDDAALTPLAPPAA